MKKYFQNDNVYMESIHLQADALKGLLIVPICVIATFRVMPEFEQFAQVSMDFQSWVM